MPTNYLRGALAHLALSSEAAISGPVHLTEPGGLFLAIGDKMRDSPSAPPRQKFRKCLIRTGDFHKESEDLSFTVTAAMLENWAAQFHRMKANGVDVPIPDGHDYSGRAANNRGYVRDMFVEPDESGGQKLIGICEMIGEDAILAANRSDVSIFSDAQFVDGNGVVYNQPILHCALCTDPVITGLGAFVPIAASRKRQNTENKMDFSKLKEAFGIDKELTADNAEEVLLECARSMKESLKQAKDSANKAGDLESKLSAAQSAIDELKSAKGEGEKEPDSQLVELSRENRQAKLDALVESGRITPAVKDKLVKAFIGDNDEALKLSLKRRANAEFNAVVDALRENDPVGLGVENTGPQSRNLRLSKGTDDNADILVKNAEKRAAAAGK